MILTEATQERATPLSGQPAAALGIIKNKKKQKKPHQVILRRNYCFKPLSKWDYNFWSCSFFSKSQGNFSNVSLSLFLNKTIKDIEIGDETKI